MRLTKRNKPGYYPDYVETELYYYTGALCKLGQLEDIEDELGIDLITLFKALKKGFYYRAINAGYPNEIWFADPDNENCGIEDYCNGSYGITLASLDVAYTKDYGKTWALTREELEK